MSVEAQPRNTTARELLDAVATMFPPDHYLFLEEVRYMTGFTPSLGQTRIDAWACHLMPSGRYERTALEVKISRSDFLRELKKPQKRKPALLVSNKFLFVAPSGLIKPEELPAEAGLIEVTERGYAHVLVAAPHRDTPPPPWGFLASVARKFRDNRAIDAAAAALEWYANPARYEEVVINARPLMGIDAEVLPPEILRERGKRAVRALSELRRGGE